MWQAVEHSFSHSFHSPSADPKDLTAIQTPEDNLIKFKKRKKKKKMNIKACSLNAEFIICHFIFWMSGVILVTSQPQQQAFICNYLNSPQNYKEQNLKVTQAANKLVLLLYL